MSERIQGEKNSDRKQCDKKSPQRQEKDYKKTDTPKDDKTHKALISSLFVPLSDAKPDKESVKQLFTKLDDGEEKSRTQEKLHRANMKKIFTPIEPSPRKIEKEGDRDSFDAQWSGKVCKGNARGETGWVTIPHELLNKINVNKRYCLSITSSKDISLSCISKPRISHSSWGFYIPQYICASDELIGQDIYLRIKETTYFPAKISDIKSVIIPNEVVDDNKIQTNDLYEIECRINGIKSTDFYQINETDRSDVNRSNELRFIIRSNIPASIQAEFKIIRKLPKLFSETSKNDFIDICSLFSNVNCGLIDENTIIVFDGKKVPIICPLNISQDEIIHYIGCYFADGTKSGSWSINASTPEQALLYKNKIMSFILNADLSYQLTYTKFSSDNRSDEQCIEDLTYYWFENCDISLEPNHIYLNKVDSVDSLKRNDYGSLRIRENKGLTLDLHLKVMNEITNYLNKTENRELMWQFLFGVLEGDGSVSGGKRRFGINFSCNIDSKSNIEDYLKKLGVNFHVDRSRIINETGRGVGVGFFLTDVIKNLDVISKNIFKYYPKRRKVFVKRLFDQPTIQYLHGIQRDSQPFLVSVLRKEGIDETKVRSILKELEKEL